eukprot:scaffold897_cov402-Prasinococcus_capsulatus_cf.AAC.19
MTNFSDSDPTPTRRERRPPNTPNLNKESGNRTRPPPPLTLLLPARSASSQHSAARWVLSSAADEMTFNVIKLIHHQLDDAST